MAWVYNPSVDLDRWLPVLSTERGDNQEADCGDIIAAFDPEYPPSIEHARLMEAVPDLLAAAVDVWRKNPLPPRGRIPERRALYRKALRERDEAWERLRLALVKAGGIEG